MLYIKVPGTEEWDEVNQMFITTKDTTLQLEHSLVSISKWESKWCKPFLDGKDKTFEETLDYVKCMTLTQHVDPNVYTCLTDNDYDIIRDYINAPMTATWFPDTKKGNSTGETVTNELIYYWMIALNIPMECQKWHLNRLLTLVEVCNVKNKPAKKMSKRDIMSRNSVINAARRKSMNTKG